MLNTGRLWTQATLTASLTAPRSRAAFTFWSREFLGIYEPLNEESQKIVSDTQFHSLSFIVHRDDFKNIPPLDAKKLEVFRTVREITGFYMQIIYATLSLVERICE